MLRTRNVLVIAGVVGVFGAVMTLQACGSNPSNTTTALPDSGAAGDVVNDMDSGVGDDADDAADTGDDACGFVGCDASDIDAGDVPSTCDEAVKRNSYIACDYWPTVTLNPVYPQFDFAVAVSNPQSVDVNVTVNGGALQQAIQVTVPAGQVQAIPLPWVPALKGPTFDQNTVVADPGKSRLVTGGAYHLTTDFPVSVYQFNALEFEIDAGAGCPGYVADAGPDSGGNNLHCYSYSNDATLLLPSNVATQFYGVLAWPSFAATPGFLAVTATGGDGGANPTNVTVYPSGRVQGLPDAGPALMVRGDSYTYTLNPGDVLEMFSDTGDIHKPVYTSDLSGTIIQSDQPIVVYGGHGCTFIPSDKKACDHLESTMFPFESLGTEYIVPLVHTPHGEHMWARIMAFYDNTQMVFDPPVSGRNGAVLNTGDVLDLPDIDQSFAIVANGRIMVAQYMLGEWANAAPDAGVPNPDLGDPSECPNVNLAEWRRQYSFLAPQTYTENWIDIVVPMDMKQQPPVMQSVTLDGNPINSDDCTANPVGGQPFCVAHEQLPANGPEYHEIHSVGKFGLYVYGYGSRTSYMYPGGLNVYKQNIKPPPK